jgi:hypothetical protein
MAWATTEDTLRMSLKRIVQIWQMRPGKTVRNTSLYWYRGRDESNHIASITVKEFSLGQEGFGALEISFSKNKGPTVRQVIKIVSTRPRYGGMRWWFVCPRTGKRCLYLYLPANENAIRFLSRKSYGLKYESQKETALQRSRRRIDRLEVRYKVPDCLLGEGWFPKPKGMHVLTYERQLATLEAAIRQEENQFMWECRRFL